MDRSLARIPILKKLVLRQRVPTPLHRANPKFYYPTQLRISSAQITNEAA